MDLSQLLPLPSSPLPLRDIQGNRRPHAELQICGYPAKVQSIWDLCARTKCIVIHGTSKSTTSNGKKGWIWRENGTSEGEKTCPSGRQLSPRVYFVHFPLEQKYFWGWLSADTPDTPPLERLLLDCTDCTI